MMMFWKAGLVFLAVPKTGTQAYEAALADAADMIIRHPPPLKHMTAQRFTRRLLPLMPAEPGRELQMLAVIREPRDWLGSWFRYRGRSALNGRPNSTAGLSFDQFVEAYLAAEQPPQAAVGSQHRFVTDGEDRVLADWLFAYEDQAPLRDFLGQRLGFAIAPPPRRNVSPARPLALSAELETRLRTERAGDFALHDAVAAGAYLPG